MKLVFLKKMSNNAIKKSTNKPIPDGSFRLHFKMARSRTNKMANHGVTLKIHHQKPKTSNWIFAIDKRYGNKKNSNTLLHLQSDEMVQTHNRTISQYLSMLVNNIIIKEIWRSTSQNLCAVDRKIN